MAPNAPAPELTHAQLTKRLLWKLDTHILPPLALLWLANFIDRSNIGNARIAGLEHDTRLVGNQFNTILAGTYSSDDVVDTIAHDPSSSYPVFYVTYIVIELPSNMVLKKMKANRWIPLLVTLWGFVTVMTAFAHNFSGLAAIRIFLGLCEGGLLPGLILYLSTLYKRHELQLRVGIFYASASLSGAFGGLLATAILKMDGVGGIAGWRWIFILEGIATILIGIGAALILPESLATAKFLTEEERIFAVQRFRLDNTVTISLTSGPETPSKSDEEKNSEERVEHVDVSQTLEVLRNETPEERFEWREVVRGITEIQVWLTGIAYFGLIVSLYSYSLFLPTIVAGLGYSGSQAQLHTVPPYVPAAVLTVVVAFLSDKLRWRGPFILICLPFAIIGYILAITAETNRVRYIAVFFMAVGVYPSGPSILAYCMWENKARAAGKRQGNIEKYQALVDAGLTKAPIGDRHPDFRFTL
ncbi:hypothetical protein CVT24_003214 [Panaeolus cyanescens]|uniref:Major facilitator superfamily (MFS) profile domain-containing protein n=1 Tax=Panaeolus cyanescens TaxID=181874 RepID=A0A409VUF6_9AGAR|nr:hypothetical protein CVT24_003214 [Panaeolus cyanescens]